MGAGRDYWTTYYRRVFEQRNPWLDYSNERVQAQTLALALESAGAVSGKRCLDIGCGWGQLARMIDQLGAAEVTASDVVTESIEQLRESYPRVRWICEDVLAADDLLPAGSMDLVLMIEVLQYLPFSEAMPRAWRMVSPGGRLVVIVPNAECPIVKTTSSRFEGLYAPPSAQQLMSVMGKWSDAEYWRIRGLAFSDDQSIAPYSATEWTQQPSWEEMPNRLQLLAIKA